MAYPVYAGTPLVVAVVTEPDDNVAVGEVVAVTWTPGGEVAAVTMAVTEPDLDEVEEAVVVAAMVLLAMTLPAEFRVSTRHPSISYEPSMILIKN